MIKQLALIFVLLFVVSARADTYAVIVAGAPGSTMYARHYADRVKRFSKALIDAGVPNERQAILSDASAVAVSAMIQMSIALPKSEDQFILILIGHGEIADNSCTLMLNGPDLQMKTIADLLKPLKCKSQIVMNFAGDSGDALTYLAQAGRINIAGSSPGQVNDNDFAEFILQELEHKNGGKTILDVYNRATLNFARWIVRQKMPPEEGKLGWMVEGRESAAVFKKLYDAADVPENRKFIASPASDQPDAPEPKLLPDGSPAWANRRMISESPVLDDAAQAAPASALTEKGFAAIAGSPKNGAVAAVTVIGQPSAKPPTTQP